MKAREISVRETIGGGYNDFWASKKRYVVCKGSRASKKSTTAALKIIVRMMQYPLANTLVVRKTGASLKDSCFAQLRWAIERLGVSAWWRARVSPLELEYLPTGQRISFVLSNVRESDKMQLQVEYVDISTIKPYKGNAKEHPKEQIEQIKKSMQEFGVKDPIGIWHNEIVEGHGRYLALKELGEKTIPVIRLDDLTDEQRRAYTLVHNQLTMNSGFNLDTLKVELDNIGEIDMSEFGFNLDGIGEEPQEVQEDDFDEEPPAEPKAKYGDLYQLGRHKLLCGDSTKIEDVEKLMNGCKADMVFTDPPYGVNVVGEGGSIGGDTIYGKVGKYSKVIGDDKEFDPSPILKWFEKSKIFLWGANYYANKLFNSGKWIVWDKNRGEGTNFSDCELCWTNLDGIAVKKYKCTWDGMRREGESGKRVHPTQKPIKLCANILNDYSEKGETIIDLFGGSGSTLIACEQIDRNCFMMELDPKYIDVIINRWETFTGKKAVKIA